MADEEKLQAAIGKLPKTALGINFFLRKNHIKGIAGNARKCPLAEYLKTEAGISDVSVSQRAIEGRYPILLTPTPGMKKFIRQFDKNRIGYRGLKKY